MSPTTAAPQTYLTLVSAFTNLLTVAIHTILYERAIYPAATFLTARAYNFPVRQSRHPLVCAWISDAVSAVHAQLLKCSVSRICIVIFESEGRSGRPLERFVFDVSKWPMIPSGELDTIIVRQSELQKSDDVSERPSVDLEEQFRALMSKLSVCGTRLSPLPENCTFTVSIELRDAAEPPIGHPQPWIPAQPSLQQTLLAQRREALAGDNVNNSGQQTKKGHDVGGVRSVPMRTVDAGEMVFEMWVEEGKAKFEEEGHESLPEVRSGSSVMGADWEGEVGEIGVV